MKVPILAVEGVSKFYRTYAAPVERLKRAVGLRARCLDFRALDGVSLAIRSGTALGIVGENGAGKSTLLKIISGTTAPTTGSVRVDGVVASILELGAAFHPEFTGRQNAVLYGAMLGLSRADMERKLPAIVDFAELGEFMDHPIKSYSTGMVMRLGFAVATHVDADILVIDEALAVGDGYFQKKCVDRLLAIKEMGVTILFCSHAMYYVSMFCDRAVWLKGGRVEQEGPAKDVVEAYETYLLQRGKRRLDAEAAQEPPPGAEGRKVGRIVGARAGLEPRGQEDGDSPDLLSVDLEVESSRRDEAYHVGVSLDTLDGRCLFAVATFLDGRPPLVGARRYGVHLEVPALSLAGGTFSLYAYLLDENGLHVHDEVIVPEAVRVVRERWLPSLLEVAHSWSVTAEQGTSSK